MYGQSDGETSEATTVDDNELFAEVLSEDAVDDEIDARVHYRQEIDRLA